MVILLPLSEDPERFTTKYKTISFISTTLFFWGAILTGPWENNNWYDAPTIVGSLIAAVIVTGVCYRLLLWFNRTTVKG